MPHQGSVTKMVDRMELRCFGHVIKMDSNRKPGQVWETRAEGSRRRGRPRIGWEGHVRKWRGEKVNPCGKRLGWRARGRRYGTGWCNPTAERATREEEEEEEKKK